MPNLAFSSSKYSAEIFFLRESPAGSLGEKNFTGEKFTSTESHRNFFINGSFIPCSGHAAFTLPLKQSLDDEGAACPRQASNLASGECRRGRLLKLLFASAGNSKGKNRTELLPVSASARFFPPPLPLLVVRIVSCCREIRKRTLKYKLSSVIIIFYAHERD